MMILRFARSSFQELEAAVGGKHDSHVFLGEIVMLHVLIIFWHMFSFNRNRFNFQMIDLAFDFGK